MRFDIKLIFYLINRVIRLQNTALITGASSGIGKELAELHASKGGSLVLVARSQDKLLSIQQELQEKHKVSVEIIISDLSQDGSAQKVFEATQAKGIDVDILINNAGVGGHGKFHERNLAEEEAMMQLNMRSLTQLTHLYLQPMVARRSGKILNVASTAGFLPGPLQAVYFATKAYVLSFSQALAEEVKDLGISITALCPGYVETNFAAAGNLEGVNAFQKGATPQSVAKCGYKAMEKGRLVAINEARLSFLLNWIIPLMPRKLILKFARHAMEKPD